jgi:DNA-binding transcriptional ArsR family regulator
MRSVLVEEGGEEKKAYNSVIVDPKNLGILSNELTLRIIRELAKNSGCALDLARSLGVHEQKIYYHLRKLEGAGIIKLLRNERRFGMTAKIYDVVSPVVAAKLYDAGFSFKDTRLQNLRMVKFLHPFIEKGKLNAKIVVGDPYPHGRFDTGSKSAVHLFDFAVLLGQVLNMTSYSHYTLDIHFREEDMKGNIIVIGNPKENVIFDKLNSKIPVFFDKNDDWSIKSTLSKKIYKDPRNGFILKWENPFNKDKSVLLFGGKRTRGLQGAMIAFTQYFKDLLEKKPSLSGVIVEGYDKDGDANIDSVKILETIE